MAKKDKEQTVETMQEQVAKLTAIVEKQGNQIAALQMKQKLDAKKKAQKTSAEKEMEEKVRREREIRRYIKKSGGLRKGLSESDKAKCAVLIRAAVKAKDRDNLEFVWDDSITVPGMDNPTVANIVYKKPV